MPLTQPGYNKSYDFHGARSRLEDVLMCDIKILRTSDGCGMSIAIIKIENVYNVYFDGAVFDVSHQKNRYGPVTQN